MCSMTSKNVRIANQFLRIVFFLVFKRTFAQEKTTWMVVLEGRKWIFWEYFFSHENLWTSLKNTHQFWSKISHIFANSHNLSHLYCRLCICEYVPTNTNLCWVNESRKAPFHSSHRAPLCPPTEAPTEWLQRKSTEKAQSTAESASCRAHHFFITYITLLPYDSCVPSSIPSFNPIPLRINPVKTP